jgi:hypothetical protein
MNDFLDALIRLFFKLCPSLAHRMDIAIRARVKYQFLKRDEPVPAERIYGDSEAVERHERFCERWERNLERYLELYEEARFPCDPSSEQLRQH